MRVKATMLSLITVLVALTFGQATLRPTTDDGKSIEDGPMWEMSRH